MSESDAQARIYETGAEGYDALIAAEDADGEMRRLLLSRVACDGARVIDVGAGTGRLARWIAPHAREVWLVDRAAPMLEVARRRLAEDGLADRVTVQVGDARALPAPSGAFDVAVAGWVFGHFRHWMPDGWRDEVDRAVAEMRRVLAPGGRLAILETLGTGHETPRRHEGLDAYFAHLEEAHGLTREWRRTDYAFESPEDAARVLRPFFGDALAERIEERRWSRVPECTALFFAELGLGEQSPAELSSAE